MTRSTGLCGLIQAGSGTHSRRTGHSPPEEHNRVNLCYASLRREHSLFAISIAYSVLTVPV